MGFTKVQDDVFDAFLAADVSKRHAKVFLYVYRNTVGWGVDAVSVKPSEASAATNLPRQVITQTINELVTLGMLVTSDAGVSVQHDVTKWDTVSQNMTSRNVTPNVTKRDTKRHKTCHLTTLNPPIDAAFEAPKDSTDMKDNPHTPKGVDAEVPFSKGSPTVALDEAEREHVEDTLPKPAPYTPDFEAFWAAHPGGGSKKKAAESFKKALKAGVTPAQMLDAIAAQKRDRAKFQEKPIPGDFYPHWKNAVTWLNGACWDDKLKFPVGLSLVPDLPVTKPIPPEFADAPWLGIWLKETGPSTGVVSMMNLARAVGGSQEDAQKAFELWKTEGPRAAGDWVWQNCRTS